MAIQKITGDVIATSAVTADSLADTTITAAKLHTTLDLTGKTVTVATASAGDNDTTVASTAFVSTAVANLADSAPSTLDTLNELAAALGDDANFSTTVTTSIATKLPLAGGTMTGNITLGDNNKAIFGAGDDLQIYHNSSNNSSYIDEGGAGDLYVRATNIWFQNTGPTATFAKFTSGGAVELRHNDGAKLATTSTGIDVTGTVSVSDNILNAGAAGSSTVFNESGSTADFRVESDGNTHMLFVDGGNNGIGIGTSSPGAALQVNRGSSSTNAIIGSEQGQNRVLIFKDIHSSPNKYNWLVGSQYNVSNAFEITPSTAVGGSTFTAGTGVTVTYDGQVLVGTTDGTTIGSVDKNLVVGSRTNNHEVAFTLNVMEGTNNRRVKLFLDDDDGVFGLDSTASTGVAPFVIRIGGVEKLRLDTLGNIGNAGTPKATVHIKPAGNDWEHALLLEHDNSTTGWNIHPERQDNSLWFGYNADTSTDFASQTANEYLVLDSSGGVGIGNNRPTASAHTAANNLVIGNTSTSNNGMTILGDANNTGRIFFGDPDLDRSGQIEYVHNGDILQFYTGNALSTKMTEGRLGIGVTPSEVFHTYVASGSNEYRNQLGSNSVYMRHGISRSTPQGANVFDIIALQNQDIVIGTSNMFLVGDGGVHNSEGSNRLRVDGTGVTIGEVLPTLTTTNESVERRLWVRGQGVFHSQDQGTLLPRAGTSALNIGPSGTRGTTGNAGTAAYNATTPTGHVHGGIAWDHLMNYGSYGNMNFNSKPHAWLGMELHSTPGHELSNMIMCTREGTASTSEPLVAQRWYATGEITTPRNPAFHAHGGSLANQTTEGNHGSWTETFDRSGDYVGGTTNVFTAPVDGVYAFYAHCNFNNNSSTPYYWRAIKNNGGVGIFYGDSADGTWSHVQAFITIVLDKNDSFEWYYKGDPDEGVEWAQLGGYLIG
jgi:hypothetical protein